MKGPDAYRLLEGAYRTMARRANHRPAATRDHPTIVDLDMEATSYAAGWLDEERHDLAHVIDYPAETDWLAVVYTVEAARALCEGHHASARELPGLL